MKKTMLFAAAAALALPLVAFAGPVKAGQRGVTIEGGPRGTTTVTKCVTQEEADHSTAPKMRDDDCKVDSFKVEGNTMSWKVTCAKRGATMEGKTTYSGDTFTGET